MIDSITNYPFLEPLKTNWQDVKKEFEGVRKYLATPEGEDRIYTTGWNVLPLYLKSEAYNDAFSKLPTADNIENNILALCPTIKSAIIKIPNLAGCWFSVMKPGCIITPHCHPRSFVLMRSHLGLICPHRGVTLTVGETTARWTEGEMFVFNDSIIHSARNLSKQERVILITDFIV